MVCPFRKKEVKPSGGADSCLRGAYKRICALGIMSPYLNRHRWIGRVDHGERENPCLGTLQYSGRNLGIRPALPQGGATAKDIRRLFTKNTAPC